MKRALAGLLMILLVCQLVACSSGSAVEESNVEPAEDAYVMESYPSNILIAYAPTQSNDRMTQAALSLGETFHVQTMDISTQSDVQIDAYEFILLGFCTDNSLLPQQVQDFLREYDFGARTIYPFVLGQNNDSQAILAAISDLQPGALLGDSALLFSFDTRIDTLVQWGQSLGIFSQTVVPANTGSNTVAVATVIPDQQQVFYLWEEGNMPTITEYTVNDGRYSDDPDFRPCLTSFPVPQGVAIKGAVLICPGGAFQFRSDQPEGVEVAQALSAIGYQSFVVDYRLRPYTQQEGALDLARAVRFVRAHAGAYGIDERNIAVMGFSAGGILSGEMLLHFDADVNGTALDPTYRPDALDEFSADAAACGMIYSFYGRLSVGTTDVTLLQSGELPPTFYCYGTRDPFYEQFLANADAAEQAGVSVERLQLDGMPHGFGADGGWIPNYDRWLTEVFQPQ